MPVRTSSSCDKRQLPQSTGRQRRSDDYDEARELLALALPVMATSALEYLPGLTSTILAGHVDSTRQKEFVDAATLSTMLMNISGYAVGFGLLSAVDTLCAQAHGAGRPDKIGIYFYTGLMVLGLCLVPIGIVNWFTTPLLLALGQDQTIATLAGQFSRYYSLVGMPGVFVYELFRKVLQAQNVMTPLVVIAVVGNAAHAIGGYVLAVHTSWGFEGIALSRSLANSLMPGLVVVYICRNQWDKTRGRWWWRSGAWNWAAYRSQLPAFLALGIPGMLLMVMEWWAFELLSLLAGLVPTSTIVQVSAHAIQLNVASLLYMLLLGFAVAANVRIGQLLGAHEPRRAQQAVRVVLILVSVVATVLGVLLYHHSNRIPRYFVQDHETADLATRVLCAWAPFVLAEGLNCVLQGLYRGAGRQRQAATINALAFYGIGIPLAAWLALRSTWGVVGLWLGFGMGVFTSAALLDATLWRWDWSHLADVAGARLST